MKENLKSKILAKYISPIEEGELIIRMIEAAGKVRRPKGATIEQVFALTDNVTLGNFKRAARAAILYWEECINNANILN